MATYEFTAGGDVQSTFDVGDNIMVTLVASRIRSERTGRHATILAKINGKGVAYDTFNFERAKGGRSDFIREVMSRLKEDGQTLLVDKLEKEAPLSKLVDEFCIALWDFYQTQYTPIQGAPTVEPKRPDFLLTPFVLEGGGTILYAQPGSGKSFASLLMGASIANGCTRIWPVKQARTLFINLERSDESLCYRLYGVNKLLGVENDEMFRLPARGKSLNAIHTAATRCIASDGIEFIILDSISRGGLGSMVDDEVANSIVDMLNSLARSWLAIAHTPKNSQEKSIFGSQMFSAGADLAIQLSSQGSPGQLVIKLMVTKANDIAIPAPQYMGLDFNEKSMLMGVHRVLPSSVPSLQEGKVSMKDVVYQLLLGARLTASEIEKETGYSRAEVSRMLTTDHDFMKCGERTVKGQEYTITTEVYD